MTNLLRKGNKSLSAYETNWSSSATHRLPLGRTKAGRKNFSAGQYNRQDRSTMRLAYQAFHFRPMHSRHGSRAIEYANLRSIIRENG